MLEGDVAHGGDVEEAGESVGALGGEDVKERHAAVEACQATLTSQQLPINTHTQRGQHSTTTTFTPITIRVSAGFSK